MCKDIRREYTTVSKIEDGVKIFKAEKWKGFCQLISEEFVSKSEKEAKERKKYYLNDYVWRGHRCENWDLISYFDREFKKYCKEHCGKNENLEKCSDPKKCRQYILERHTNSFTYACRNKLDEFGIKMREFLEFTRKGKGREKFWWALGQHYGMATPMLDWCYSPFVAAFFAFEEGNSLEDIDWVDTKITKALTSTQEKKIVGKFKKCINEVNKEFEKCEYKATKEKFINRLLNKKLMGDFKKQKRVIWGFNFKKVCRNCENVYRCRFYPEKCAPHTCEEKCILYFDPMSSEYPRLINQRGLFTISNTGECVRELVKDKFADDNEPVLIKIKISNKEGNREDFLRGLNSMGINHTTIYPEIYGAAKFCNLGIEFDDYARFHGQGPKVEDDPREICNKCQED